MVFLFFICVHFQANKNTVKVVRKVHLNLCKLNCICFEMAEHSTTKPHYETNDAEIKGFLLKWTNYIKGYQRRWFVLSNGVLSYYRCDLYSINCVNYRGKYKKWIYWDYD